ncbi:MAG: proton-conducting transporter membrane subunit [Rhodobacterales bacterium]
MMADIVLWTGPVLPLVALLWPVLMAGLAALPAVRLRSIRLLPLAPLPALVLALTAGEAETTAPHLLLGVVLQLDESGRLLLGLTAALWLIAGLAAQTMVRQPNAALFAAFWCLTLAGNLGVFLARDIATFYVSFAAVSLAAWFLVVHDRTETAQRAGLVYIVIAVLGEVCLLLGLLMSAHAADSLEIAALREMLGGPDAPALALPLLVIGFGIKAGMVPLHVWLPLAHPAAPVAASAVLSGAIVKAGLYGLMQFLPEGQGMQVLVVLGAAGAFLAALWGLTQSNPKAVLAYSTISQMGLMILLIGTGGAARDSVAYFAAHHGFAKGALFLLCGMMLSAVSHGQRVICLVVAAVVAASVAGLPLSGGALAKSVSKSGLTDDLALLLSLSSVTTTLILVWFLHRLWALPMAETAPERWGLRLVLPTTAGVLAMLAPWLLWADWSDQALGYNLAQATLTDAIWPVLVALPVALILLRKALPAVPPGDLLLVLPRWPFGPVTLPEVSAPSRRLRAFGTATSALVSAAEHRLIRWSLSGTILAALVLVFLAALVFRSH